MIKDSHPSRADEHNCPSPVCLELWSSNFSCPGRRAEEGVASPLNVEERHSHHPVCKALPLREAEPHTPPSVPTAHLRPWFSSHPNFFSVFEFGFSNIKIALRPLLKSQGRGCGKCLKLFWKIFSYKRPQCLKRFIAFSHIINPISSNQSLIFT